MTKSKMIKNLMGGIIIVGCLLFSYIGGYVFQDEDKPIIESTALYPELNLEELSIRAEYIISGKVTDVKNTELREIQTYEDIEMTVPTEVIEYPVTPVTVAVEEAIKGDVENVFTFYQDGGITDTYIQLPDGEKLETGDEVIIFASESKEGWGQRSVFSIINDEVRLNSSDDAYFLLDEENSKLNDKEINGFSNSKNNTNIVKYDTFVGKIKEFVNQG